MQRHWKERSSLHNSKHTHTKRVHHTTLYSECITKHAYFPYRSTYNSTRHNTNRKHNTILQHSKANRHYLSHRQLHNKHYHRPPHTHYNIHTKQTCAIYIHISKYCAHLHHILAALKISFPVSSRRTLGPTQNKYITLPQIILTQSRHQTHP